MLISAVLLLGTTLAVFAVFRGHEAGLLLEISLG
jgi:hypothetical protein